MSALSEYHQHSKHISICSVAGLWYPLLLFLTTLDDLCTICPCWLGGSFSAEEMLIFCIILFLDEKDIGDATSRLERSSIWIMYHLVYSRVDLGLGMAAGLLAGCCWIGTQLG